MEITTKTKVIISVVVVAGAFASGRYLTPEKIKIEVKTVEVEKKVKDTSTDTNQNKKKDTKIVETKKPNGEIVTETTITETTVIDKKKEEQETIAKIDKKDSTSETTKGDSKVTINALGGFDFRTGLPVYGASVTKPVAGPLTLGVFGLSNTTVGASLGLQF